MESCESEGRSLRGEFTQNVEERLMKSSLLLASKAANSMDIGFCFSTNVDGGLADTGVCELSSHRRESLSVSSARRDLSVNQEEKQFSRQANLDEIFYYSF